MSNSNMCNSNMCNSNMNNSNMNNSNMCNSNMNGFGEMNILYYNPENEGAKRLSRDICEVIAKKDLTERSIVILCIGTDRATGDCLGPLVGDMLIKKNCKWKNSFGNIEILGTLNEPIHALNIRNAIKKIYRTVQNPYVIAIDAALGSNDHVGCITLSESPVAPGKGVNKKLPIIGDLSITGIVNVMSNDNHRLLQSTRLSFVIPLAEFIAEAISESLGEYV